MPSWPASLPQHQLIPATYQRQDAVLRTQMDSGPTVRRNRFTAVSRNISVSVLFTYEELQTFEEFYSETLRNGSLAFDWQNPIDFTTVTMYFRGEPPKWTTAGGIHWSATLELEIEP